MKQTGTGFVNWDRYVSANKENTDAQLDKYKQDWAGKASSFGGQTDKALGGFKTGATSWTSSHPDAEQWGGGGFNDTGLRSQLGDYERQARAWGSESGRAAAGAGDWRDRLMFAQGAGSYRPDTEGMKGSLAGAQTGANQHIAGMNPEFARRGVARQAREVVDQNAANAARYAENVRNNPQPQAPEPETPPPPIAINNPGGASPGRDMYTDDNGVPYSDQTAPENVFQTPTNNSPLAKFGTWAQKNLLNPWMQKRDRGY